MNYFYDVDQEYESEWYQEDMSITHTQAPGENTDLQFSYNLGYATSAAGFGMTMYGVGVYAGAQSSLFVTLGVTLMEGMARFGQFNLRLIPRLSRSIPMLGLLFGILALGTDVGQDIRRVPLDTRVKG